MKTFSERLRKAREDGGFKSAQQFAGVLGLEPHAYRKYERGQSEPNFEILVRICEVLNVTPNYLLPLAAQGRGRKSGSGGGSQIRAA